MRSFLGTQVLLMPPRTPSGRRAWRRLSLLRRFARWALELTRILRREGSKVGSNCSLAQRTEVAPAQLLRADQTVICLPVRPKDNVKLQLRNRFIHVGVYISSYALLIGGRGSYPPCVGLVTIPAFSLYICISVILDYPWHGYVLYRTRIIKSMCVHRLYLQG